MRDIKSITSEGRAVLADGTELQLAIDNAGTLHARPVTMQDHLAKIDQHDPDPVRMMSPEQLSAGLDQG